MVNFKNIKLSNNVVMYYEPLIEDGKVFLYNAKEKISWEGNNSAYAVVKYLLDDYVSISDIQNSICKLYPDESPEQLKDAVNLVIEDLQEKKFLDTLWMNKNWKKRSLEECINISFEHILNESDNDYFSKLLTIFKSNNIRPTYPLKIEWLITNKCNLRCEHCMCHEINFFDNNKESELTTEQIFKIIDEFHEMTIYNISLTGGEALLRPDIFDILKYIKKRNISITIVSNGVEINEEVISKLKTILNPNIDSLQISLDGTKELHEETRGKGTYDKTINAIKNLINEGFKVNVNYTITSKNIGVLPDVFKLCGEMGINYFSNSRFACFDKQKEYLKADEDLLFKAEAEIINLLNNYPTTRYTGEIFTFKNLSTINNYIKYLKPEYKEAIYSKELKQQKLMCHSGIYCLITPEGLILPCENSIFAREFLKDDIFLMGDLKKESFKDIWNKRFDNIILQEINLEDVEGCRDCQLNGICNANCRAFTYTKQKSIYKPPIECNVCKCK